MFCLTGSQFQPYHLLHVNTSLPLPLLPLSLSLRVQMLKASNKMDAKNLSVIFAPTIMRSPYSAGVMAVQKLPQQRKAVEILITKCHELFKY